MAVSVRRKEEHCHRCELRVYPVERVDIGVVYHKGCFRCRVCSIQLTLKNFKRELDLNSSRIKEVYCSTHAPKTTGRIDQEAVGIRSALNAPKRGATVNEQIRGSMVERGWQYDANALEFEHRRGQMKPRRRPTLTSFKDFEDFGVFEAQSTLEEKQQEEEDDMYRTILRDRKARMAELEEELRLEKEKTVRELIGFFEKMGFTTEDRQERMRKLEEYWKRKREERIQELLYDLTAEEQGQLVALIDKHTHEMLMLLAEKEKEADPTVDEESMYEFATLPHVAPPSCSKVELVPSPEEFKELDHHAIEIAKGDPTSFTGLVRELSRRCETQLQKLRAIYRWITVKDLNKMHFDENVDPDSPLGLLRGIKYGTESYHILFKRLCSYVGLHVDIIGGFSKGAGYRPGAKIGSLKFRNQWTAVFLDGSWRFVNTNWGARHTKGPKTGSRDLHYKCDEIYFLTDPEDHIYQHFPDDPSWQLLPKAITLAQFEKLPLLKSPFFSSKLSLVGLDNHTVMTDTGRVQVTLKIRHLVAVAAKLESRKGIIPADLLKDRTLVRIVDDEIIVNATAPRPGDYYIDIFVSEDRSSQYMDNACSFRIRCTNVDESADEVYPGGSFGRTPYMSIYAITENTHRDPLIDVKGELFLSFGARDGTKLSHSLKLWNRYDGSMFDCDKFSMLNYRSDNEANYVIHCPKAGQFVFSLFATTGDEKDAEMNSVLRYLIRCHTPVHGARPFPKTSRRWKGCKVIEPISGILPLSANIKFKIEAPSAVELAVAIGEKWQNLKSSGLCWQEVIATGSKSTKAMVYGRFTEYAEKFIPLLEYHIQ